MPIKHSLLGAITLFFVAFGARAGVLVEPYLSYELGVIETPVNSFPSGPLTKFDASGPGFGLRLAYTLPVIAFLGVDYSLATYTSKVKEGTSSGTDFNRSSLFAIAGASLPLIRAYAGYGFINDWVLKASGSDATYKGSAVKLGAGFTGLPFIAINLEYIMSTFKKVSMTSGEVDVSGSKADMFVLSVSLPLEF